MSVACGDCARLDFCAAGLSSRVNERPFLDRRSGDSYSYGFLLTGDFHLWLSELFNLTIDVELKRMGSGQNGHQGRQACS